MRKNIYIILILMLLAGLALSGCTEVNDVVDDTDNDIDDTDNDIDDTDNDIDDTDNDIDDIDNGEDVAQASSLRYTWSWESPEESKSWSYMAKNIGTENLKLRIEFVEDDEETGAMVINKEQRKIWSVENDEWDDMSEMYEILADIWAAPFQEHLTNLYGWAGEPIEITPFPNQTYRFHGVEINPTLPDSLFEPI